MWGTYCISLFINSVSFLMHFWNNCFLKEIWTFKTVRNTWERTWELGSIINIPRYLLWIKSSQYKFWGTSIRRTKGRKFPWLKCYLLLFNSVQFSSVAHLCLTLCDPMDCSTPGLPVYHQLPEITQTHVCKTQAHVCKRANTAKIKLIKNEKSKIVKHLKCIHSLVSSIKF